VVAGVLLAQPRLAAHALGGINSLSVNPAHGKANFTFKTTYAVSPCLNAVGLVITFSWGTMGPTGQILGTATTDSACRATISAAPPAATRPGTVQVFGYVALPTGIATPGSDASTSYTVDITPTPAPTPAASAPRATAAATSAATAQASDTTGTTAATGTTGTKPATVTPGLPALTRSGGGHTLWWTLGWPVGLLGLLALGLLAIAAFLFAGAVRRRGRLAAALRKDKAA
jgi:hypothetical protein